MIFLSPFPKATAALSHSVNGLFDCVCSLFMLIALLHCAGFDEAVTWREGGVLGALFFFLRPAQKEKNNIVNRLMNRAVFGMLIANECEASENYVEYIII